MIRLLQVLWWNRRDDAATMQRDPRPAPGAVKYDWEKAQAGARKARTQSETGRPLPKPKPRKPASVQPFGKRAAK